MQTPEPQAPGHDLAVPYPALFAEYQERVNALTHENLMLRAVLAHLRSSIPQPAAAGPIEEKENGS